MPALERFQTRDTMQRGIYDGSLHRRTRSTYCAVVSEAVVSARQGSVALLAAETVFYMSA